MYCISRIFMIRCSEKRKVGKGMKKFLAVCVLAISMFCITSCGSKQEETTTTGTQEAVRIEFTDDMGNEISMERPERVACMIGSFADIFSLAGGRDLIVATANDSWNSFPQWEFDADQVGNLGAIKEPNVEVLLASNPDLVIASMNTKANVEMKDMLTQAGITVAYFDVQEFSDYYRMLDICTKITGKEENLVEYGDKVKVLIEEQIARTDDTHPTVLCIRATGSTCKVKASEDNVLGEMLLDLGCVNVADSDESLLEELSLEAIIAADPDYIFAVLQGSDSTDAQKMLEETLLNNPAWSSLRAVQEDHFYTMEHSLYNLKPNARWGEAYEKLADILYPEN